MDKDAEMIQAMGSVLTDLQLRYRAASLMDRIAIKPALEELLADYTRFQVRLLKEGVITTDEDLIEMKKIRSDIAKAATKQRVVSAIARTIAFVATRA